MGVGVAMVPPNVSECRYFLGSNSVYLEKEPARPGLSKLDCGCQWGSGCQWVETGWMAWLSLQSCLQVCKAAFKFAELPSLWPSLCLVCPKAALEKVLVELGEDCLSDGSRGRVW